METPHALRREGPPVVAAAPPAARRVRPPHRMSAPELAIPDYRVKAPEVAARFERIRQRQVILSVRDLRKQFVSDDGSLSTVFDHVSLDIHRREFICVIGPSG